MLHHEQPEVRDVLFKSFGSWLSSPVTEPRNTVQQLAIESEGRAELVQLVIPVVADTLELTGSAGKQVSFEKAAD